MPASARRLIGRSFIYGLGPGGELGVEKAIEIIRKELDVGMALTGSMVLTNPLSQ